MLRRYNAVLSFHQLVENADECMLLDNEALCINRSEAPIGPLRSPRGSFSVLVGGFGLDFMDFWGVVCFCFFSGARAQKKTKNGQRLNKT